MREPLCVCGYAEIRTHLEDSILTRPTPGIGLSAHELLDAMWGKVVVENGDLHVHVSALRKLLAQSCAHADPWLRLPVQSTDAVPARFEPTTGTSQRLSGRPCDFRFSR